MAGIIESFRQGYEGRDPGRYAIGGKSIVCSHCGGDRFDSGSALLNTRKLTLLGIDFADRGANLLICTACTHIEWFLDEPHALQSSHLAERSKLVAESVEEVIKIQSLTRWKTETVLAL